jgi:hypothetical protein
MEQLARLKASAPEGHWSPDHDAGHPPLTACRQHLRLSERPRELEANGYREVPFSLFVHTAKGLTSGLLH